MSRPAKTRAPKIGFVSLGCPKALVDSERILTHLRAQGSEVSPTYTDADVVVVNTCGFIDSAIDESLDAIGEALEQNGRVIVTGCLGAKPERILERHPRVLKVTGPHAYEDVLTAVHEHLPPQHDPFFDLVPPQGVRLTPRHYAYLKVSEGCNNKCSFCIIPAMRGKLASRRIDDVLREGERLVQAGVKELLVISQDTSAYGTDIRYAAGSWRDEIYQTRFIDLARGLGSLGVWVRLHYVYPYPHVDDVIPLMTEGRVLPYLDVPFQHGSASVLKRHIEIGQHAPLCHEGDDVVDVRVGINIVQPDPHPQGAQPAGQVDEASLIDLIAPGAGRIADVCAVCARVLRDDEQLLDSSLYEPLAFAQHVVDPPARELAAHGRDDAEAALVVAALRDLQISIVAGREPHPLRGHEIEEWIVLRGQVLMHCGEHVLIGVRS